LPRWSTTDRMMNPKSLASVRNELWSVESLRIAWRFPIVIPVCWYSTRGIKWRCSRGASGSSYYVMS
jgi:hypothetical protein